MNIYIYALGSSFLFLIAKFILNKYINKKNKPIKQFLKDSIIVFMAVIIFNFIFINFINIELNDNEISVFTDTPNF